MEVPLSVYKKLYPSFVVKRNYKTRASKEGKNTPKKSKKFHPKK
jgi:hypothetical protein